LIVCFDTLFFFASFKKKKTHPIFGANIKHDKGGSSMASSCFHAFRLRRSKSKPLKISSSSKSHSNSEMENLERKRFDSLESWSMILESENVETWEASKEDQEEWTADLSQLFIGNKFASGAHSRIYRGIYKQRAVAVKMVRIPTQKEETRAFLEQQFKCEVALLSRLFHPNIVQVCVVLHSNLIINGLVDVISMLMNN